MKSEKLFLFKTESINFVNLLQFCLYLSRGDLYQPCIPIIKHQHLTLIPGDFCLFYDPNDPIRNFRNIDWRSKIHSLNDLLSGIDQPIVFGNNSIDQIRFLKSNVNHSCATISCSYDEEYYDFILNYFTRSHISKQMSGQLEITNLDQQLRNDQSIDLFLWYKNSFDQQNLVPKSLNFDTDYTVPLRDFFDKERFFWHLTNIGGSESPEALDYYNNWLENQNSFFE